MLRNIWSALFGGVLLLAAMLGTVSSALSQDISTWDTIQDRGSIKVSFRLRPGSSRIPPPTNGPGLDLRLVKPWQKRLESNSSR